MPTFEEIRAEFNEHLPLILDGRDPFPHLAMYDVFPGRAPDPTPKPHGGAKRIWSEGSATKAVHEMALSYRPMKIGLTEMKEMAEALNTSLTHIVRRLNALVSMGLGERDEDRGVYIIRAERIE